MGIYIYIKIYTLPFIMFGVCKIFESFWISYAQIDCICMIKIQQNSNIINII